MSVQKNMYMIIGAKFDYNEFYNFPQIKEEIDEIGWWERGEKYWDSAFKGIHHHNGLCIISDGMNGKYVYVGHVLKKSSDYGDIDDYINREIAPSPEVIKSHIKSEFGIDAECETHVFTHYR